MFPRCYALKWWCGLITQISQTQVKLEKTLGVALLREQKGVVVKLLGCLADTVTVSIRSCYGRSSTTA